MLGVERLEHLTEVEFDDPLGKDNFNSTIEWVTCWIDPIDPIPDRSPIDRSPDPPPGSDADPDPDPPDADADRSDPQLRGELERNDPLRRLILISFKIGNT